ncbi:MAG TPA: hypothetical protein VN114_01175 [Oxalicibacterium sp.]|uniref:hypothetical protein n=1 Tax=Oxalicibacterium sp. TaxID=2766525 RepID=UPI002C8EEC1E|nr:hypothetical protein [Oxalicibacterium sp.]HWU97098.1 hypothetical protein [Oxalicibacterium sp.]
MQSGKIGDHDIEYEAVQVAGTKQWAAYLAIYGPSNNPMHRNNIFPHQHVCVNETFMSREEAEAGALAAAETLLKSGTHSSS